MAAMPQDLVVDEVAPQPLAPRPAPRPVAVPPRRHRRPAAARRPARYIAAMVILGALGIFGSVALNALAAEQSFAVRELEQEVADLTRSADELTVNVTRLESPARLHRTAVRQLGMVRAEQPAFVVLPGGASTKSDKSSRTMQASVLGD